MPTVQAMPLNQAITPAIASASINNIGLSSGHHRHHYHQLLFGIQGQTRCAFDTTENIIDLTCCCAVPAGQGHAYKGITGNADILVINFEAEGGLSQLLRHANKTSFLETLFGQGRFIPADIQLAQQVQTLANNLLTSSADPLLQLHLVTGLLLKLENLLAERECSSGRKGKISLARLNQLIDGHLSKPLSVSAMATYMGVSESHFYAKFVQSFHESPHQYALNRRLCWAKNMIASSNLTLSDIAYEIGFSSLSAFSRAFKQRFHCSPSQWR